ncbi:MAG: hypothetical protein ACQEQF_11840 [Bacillota bacterium]
MKKSTIVTILLIILIGIMFVDININGSDVFELFFRRLETNSMFENRLNYSTNANYEYSVDKKLVVENEDKEKLEIDNNFGSIDIIGEKREDIEIKAKVTVYSMEEEIAKDYAEKFEIEAIKEDSSINIIRSNENIPEDIKGVKIDYIIKAPESIIPALSNQFGKLEIRNFINGVELSNRYKETIVENISGDKIDINAKYGNLTINNISKGNEMNVITAYNKSNIREVRRALKIDGSYGKIVIDNIDGKIDSKLRYGEGNFNNTGELKLDSRYTKINMNEINGEITADMNYGQITVDKVKYNTDIKGRYTEIDLNLAQELTDFEFEGKTKHGDMNTSFAAEIKKEDNTTTASYTEGDGDVKIFLETEHEDINIK